MPPSNLREHIGDLFANTLSNFYHLDDDSEVDRPEWAMWSRAALDAAITIEDFKTAIGEIEKLMDDDNKEVENIPEVSWEEMMQIKTEERNND